jgi:hypothetical protein
MIGFTPNDVPFVASKDESVEEDTIDFVKLREEFLSLESVERRDAYDDYNRVYRDR